MKAFDNFKSNQKSVWNNIFLYVKVLVSFKFIQDTLHWDKTQMLKNSDKINIPKNALILKKKMSFDSSQFYMAWSTRFVSLKVCWGFFIFDSFSLLLKFIAMFDKKHRLFHFERSFIKRQTSGISSGSEWQRVVQRVTKRDNEWQLVTASGKTNENSTIYF